MARAFVFSGGQSQSDHDANHHRVDLTPGDRTRHVPPSWWARGRAALSGTRSCVDATANDWPPENTTHHDAARLRRTARSGARAVATAGRARRGVLHGSALPDAVAVDHTRRGLGSGARPCAWRVPRSGARSVQPQRRRALPGVVATSFERSRRVVVPGGVAVVVVSQLVTPPLGAGQKLIMHRSRPRHRPFSLPERVNRDGSC